jgi:DNA polymerase V
MKIEILTPDSLPDLTFVLSYVKAGYPSPTGDLQEEKINLADILIKRPNSTFLIRVSGNSMDGVGIKNGDIIVVDRSLDPKDGDIALCVLNGEFTLKRLKFKSNGEIYLVPENPNFKEIKVKETDDFQIWGIVTYIIHKTR